MEDNMIMFITNNNNLNIPIATPISPTWKLYENPFYISHDHHHKPQQHYSTNNHHKQIHKLHLPISTRKIAASFWDLTFIKPFMDSELETARKQVIELKAELACERMARKKSETMNKKLTKELIEERKGREAMERVCQALAKDLSYEKSMIDRMKRDIEEERRMLHTAEVIREERVQMKLADAKILLEEKFSELEMVRKSEKCESFSNVEKERGGDCNIGNVDLVDVMERKGLREVVENPHIERGIRGFVEFPRVIRAIGCRSGRHLGSKLECQKARLKLVLKQKGPVVRCNNNGLIVN